MSGQAIVNRPLRLLLLTSHLRAGGIASYLLNLSQSLVEKGHVVHVVSSGGRVVADLEAVGANHWTLDLQTKTEINWRVVYHLPFLSNLVRRESIDLVHVNTRVTQVVGCYLGGVTGRPVLSTAHGFFKHRFLRTLFPYWGDAVVAVSPEVKRHLEDDLNVPAKKIRVIPNGVDTQRFSPPSPAQVQSSRDTMNLKTGSVAIGMIARFTEGKGHEVLFQTMTEVIRSFPRSVFLLIGEGPLESRLKKDVDDLGLTDACRFLGVHSDIRVILAGLDVVVLPSLGEGLPFVLLESLSMALPVVATRVGGIPSLIKEGTTGYLCEPNDQRSLVQALSAALSDPASSKAMALRAADLIRREFSSEAMTEQTLRVYRELLGGGGSS